LLVECLLRNIQWPLLLLKLNTLSWAGSGFLCDTWLQYSACILLLTMHLTVTFLLGVIAAVVFVLICLLVVMVRYMYRHKGTYHTNEAKGTEFAESADAALKNDPALQEAVDESKKEYFI
uniref:Glycophorin C (Gerbich blood group) n=1 Tax=Cairina moschata TaxID=8855 RepID=A0A8C3BAR4_CAIMO